MTSSFSSGKAHLEKPANGDDVDTWNVPLNSNADAIDACISATTTLTLSNTTVLLTQSQMQSMQIALVGNLTANVRVNFIAGVPGFFLIGNFCTGAFSVTAGTNAAGLTLTVPNGGILVYSDGGNVTPADSGGILQTVSVNVIQPGALMDFAMSTAPTGWLVCDGSAISRTTYAPLFTNIGTSWGVGNGATTFNIPNLQGRFRRTWDQSGVVDPARAFASLQADAFKTHTHGVNDPQHSHTVPVIAAVNQAGFNNSSPLGGGPASVNTSTSATGITIQNAGDTETRPTNYAVLTCIKT